MANLTERIRSKMKRYSLARRLIIYNSILGVASSLIFVIFFMVIARMSIHKAAQESVATIRDIKKTEIEGFFERKKIDMQVLASNPVTLEAMTVMKSAFNKIAQKEGRPGATALLQRLYISENPNPTGKKEFLDFAADGSEYSSLHRKFQPFFRKHVKKRNYYDIFLVDHETGDIVFTVFKERDFATNLLNGPYKDTNIARVFLEARKASEEEVVKFADYEAYEPSNNDPAAFIASPVFIRGKMEGVLIMQLSINEVNQAMKQDVGLGKSGESYLVGADKFMRTDSKFSKESTILKKKIETSGVEEALGDKVGVSVIQDYRHINVFSAYSPINFMGTKWALITEVDEEEALAEIKTLRFRVLLMSIFTVAFIAMITYFISKGISAPVSEAVGILSTSTREIAATVEQQERTTNLQSASVNQTTTTMAELGSSSQHTAVQAEAVSSGARNALNSAEEGMETIVTMVAGMEGLKAKVSVIAEQILHLSEQTNQIGNIIALVSDIANQTNMLALNAAVEAARAGEHGKGFAVVAVEIRKLADQSKKSAEKVQSIIMDIRKATDATVMATDEGTKTVEEDVRLADQAASAFNVVSTSMNQVFESTQQISLNVKQQAIAINEVVQAMNTLNSGSKENAAGVTQTKIGINQLNEATARLRDLVAGNSLQS